MAVSKRETERALSQRDVLVTETEKLQRLVREGQEKTVDLHRQSLEETRKRDADARQHNDAVRKSSSEMQARAELAEREVKTLKRRVEELLEVNSEAKRLRTVTQEYEVAKARQEAENEAIRSSLETLRKERDALRDANMEMGNRIAVLEATHKLESAVGRFVTHRGGEGGREVEG